MAIHEAWTQITPWDINAHVKHMGDRVKAVMHVKGGHTKY